MGFFDVHIVLRKAVHQFGQAAVEGLKDSHANREIAGPEQRLAFFLAHLAHLFAVLGKPSRGARHHFYVVCKGLSIVVEGRLGGGKLDGHVCRSKNRAVEVGLVVLVDDANDVVAALFGNLFNHAAHLSVAYNGDVHGLYFFYYYDVMRSRLLAFERAVGQWQWRVMP